MGSINYRYYTIIVVALSEGVRLCAERSVNKNVSRGVIDYTYIEITRGKGYTRLEEGVPGWATHGEVTSDRALFDFANEKPSSTRMDAEIDGISLCRTVSLGGPLIPTHTEFIKQSTTATVMAYSLSWNVRP